MAKVVLITGSSSGIGKATAKYFHEKGWNVVATMRSPDKEEELTKLNNVLVNELDVTKKETIKQAINEGISKFGKIDVLINNAGYGAVGLLEAASEETIRRQFNTNVIGLLLTTKEILPHFRKNKNGILVNISSICGRMTFPLMTLYQGTKFAIEGISESLSYELAEIGVKVKIVEPGAIKTDFDTRSIDAFHDESLEEYNNIIQKSQERRENPNKIRSSSELVAEVIFTSVTDGTDKLRYPAGPDAIEYMKNRSEMDDETFMNKLKQQMKLIS